jgi:hypothetical protein
MRSNLLFFTGFFLITPLFAQKDILVQTNGDELIGEVKSMTKGVIVIETDYSDSDFNIEWDKVKAFYSDRIFIISLSDGTRLDGTINTDSTNITKVLIVEEGKTITTTLIDIVLLEPIEKTFIGRLSASIDFGFNLTKANSLTQTSLRSNIGYLTDKWATDASFDFVSSSQDDADDTKRNDITVQLRRLFNKGWFASLSANFLQNDEQKLKLRTTTKAAGGNYIIHNYKLYYTVLGGLAWNNENFTDPDQETRNSAEGYIGMELNMFNIGDLNLLTSLSAYPGITESDRFRADFKIDLKYDLPLDFYVKMGYTHNYDSKPIEGASENDYVFQTTVGWEL